MPPKRAKNKSDKSTKHLANTASNKQGHKLVWDRGLQCGVKGPSSPEEHKAAEWS